MFILSSWILRSCVAIIAVSDTLGLIAIFLMIRSYTVPAFGDIMALAHQGELGAWSDNICFTSADIRTIYHRLAVACNGDYDGHICSHKPDLPHLSGASLYDKMVGQSPTTIPGSSGGKW